MWRRVIKRFGRSAIAVVAAGLVQYASGSPYALVLAPALNALGKWMRERGIDQITPV